MLTWDMPAAALTSLRWQLDNLAINSNVCLHFLTFALMSQSMSPTTYNLEFYGNFLQQVFFPVLTTLYYPRGRSHDGMEPKYKRRLSWGSFIIP